MELLCGLHLGYAKATQRRPRLHALGLGTPILLVLMSLLNDGQTYAAADSTAPIADGWTMPTTSLYVDTPAPLKYKVHRLAHYWITEGKGWDCECPYCRGFSKKYPTDIEGARSWWQQQGKPEIKKNFLYSDGALVPYFPLFANHSEAQLQKEAAMARVGHNHWIIQRLESKARKVAAAPKHLHEWGQKVVESYLSSPAGTSWKAAIREAWKLVDWTMKALDDSAPNPL